MNELPGPYIKWFLEDIGLIGLNKMLGTALMINADGFQNRSATAVCTFAYCAGPEEQVHIFEGKSPKITKA